MLRRLILVGFFILIDRGSVTQLVLATVRYHIAHTVPTAPLALRATSFH